MGHGDRGYKMSSEQETLFPIDHIPREKKEWEKEWQGMPEFIQDDLSSYRKIIIHFRSDEDVKKFSQLIDQPITPKQPSLWYPKLDVRRYAHLRYVDES